MTAPQGNPVLAREARRRWGGRIATAFVLWAAVVGVASFKGNRPDALLLGLVVAAAGTTLWLYLDTSVAVEAPVWDRDDDDPVRPPGEDPRLAMLHRVVAGHLDARQVGDSLQRHLLDIADHRLIAHHGVSWRVDPDRAAPLLGPDLVALARQQPPYPRMSPAQIDALVTRIEEL